MYCSTTVVDYTDELEIKSHWAFGRVAVYLTKDVYISLQPNEARKLIDAIVGTLATPEPVAIPENKHALEVE